MRSYRLSRKARADLKKIYIYTSETFGRRQADGYLDSIEQKLELLAEQPGIGRQRPEIDERTRSFPHESHTIYYDIRGPDLLILRVLHGSQDPFRHLIG